MVDRLILREISLTLHGGEILGVVGANGAGKSTLGLILTGVLRGLVMGRWCVKAVQSWAALSSKIPSINS